MTGLVCKAEKEKVPVTMAMGQNSKGGITGLKRVNFERKSTPAIGKTSLTDGTESLQWLGNRHVHSSSLCHVSAFQLRKTLSLSLSLQLTNSVGMAALHSSSLAPFCLKKLILIPYPKPRRIYRFQAMSSSSGPAALVHKVPGLEFWTRTKWNVSRTKPFGGTPPPLSRETATGSPLFGFETICEFWTMRLCIRLGFRPNKFCPCIASIPGFLVLPITLVFLKLEVPIFLH